nr:hypothetical protein [Tanacetum cinerariifolium]
QWDDVQEHIQADEDLAQRMLEEERESLSIEKRSRLLAKFIEKRKKMLAAKRAEEKRNKPPTQAQQRTYMSNYLKNMGGNTLKQLKQYSFEEIKMLFDNTMENIRRFVPIESECQAADSKARESAEEELGQEQKKAGGRLKRKTSKAREDKDKRQKKQDDPEKLTLIEYVEVIFDFEEVINVISLAVKSLIVNCKSYCKGDVGYYEIHRADGSYETYIFFSEMLNDFDREDLIVLYRLFNEKYASTRPGFDNLILWGDMKIMFERDKVSIHMLVEKKYPLSQDILRRMLQRKLLVNYNVTEMAYELLSFKVVNPGTTQEYSYYFIIIILKHFLFTRTCVLKLPCVLDEEIAQRFYEEKQARILRDEEYAQQVQDQWISDEPRLDQENLAQTEQWDVVQEHIQADEDLAQRMLKEERESLSIEKRSRLLAELIDKRKKMLAAKRAEEKRNKPPTQAQQRTYISNYLKNMG